MNFFLLLFVVAFIGCHQSPVLPSIRTNLTADSDGVIRDMTLERRSEHYQQLQNVAERGLRLPSLFNGYDKMQIRVWAGQNGFSSNRLYLLKHDEMKWSGELYSYRDTIKNNVWATLLINKTELPGNNQKWNILVKDLFELGIDTLPDFDMIPENGGTDADERGVLIEIAQKKFYKLYQFPSPSDRKNELKEAAQIDKIITRLEREFEKELLTNN